MSKASIVVAVSAALLLAGCSGSASSSGSVAANTPAGSGSGSAVGVASAAAPGVTAGPSGAPVASASGAPAPSASPSAPPIVVPAKVGDCFKYKSLDHWTLDEATAVPCKKKHTAQTVYVGEITDPAAISFEAVGQLDAKAKKAGGLNKLSSQEQSQWAAYVASMADVSAACDKAIVKATKAKTAGVVTASLFTSDLTGPTQAEWDKGARWVRCNAVAHLVADDFDASPALLVIPAPLSSALAKGTTYRNCWIPLAQNKAARSIPCNSRTAERGTWLTLSDQIPTPKSTWPGQKAAVAAAKAPCLSLVGHFSTAKKSSARWWVWHVDKNGVPKSGGSKATWGTPDSHFGCAMPNWQFKPRP